KVPVFTAGRKYTGILGSLYPFNTDSIVALILNSSQSDMIDNPLLSSPVTLLSTSASSSGLVVKTPAVTAASASVLARAGSTFDILTARRRRIVLANLIHLVISPLYIKSKFP